MHRPLALTTLRPPSPRPIGPSRPKIAEDISDALGQVPILRILRVSAACRTREIYMKLESCNPGGSIKEKNAAFLVKAAETSGELRPGGTIVESSSGNFGIGLAMIGAARGYRVMVVVDAKTPPPMRRLLQAYGAELVDVPLTEADASGSMQRARMKRAKELSQETANAWYPCQHLNPLNPGAHTDYTAHEIEEAFDDSLDALVIGVSTAGQIAGIGRHFKRNHPRTKIVAVDVAGSAILGTPRHPYKMTGLGLSFVPPNFDPELVDSAFSISDQLAFSVCRALARKEGLLLGASTGAITAAALAFAHQNPDAKRILLINPDRGDRYLETVYDDAWIASQGIPLLSDHDLEQAYKDLTPVSGKLLRAAAKERL